MPIGKDSIRKRVIGTDSTAAESAEAGSSRSKTAKEQAAPAEKIPAAGKTTSRRTPGRPRKAAPSAEVTAPVSVTESVLTNVSPEVVEKVVGHTEDETPEHVQITDSMPNYLL